MISKDHKQIFSQKQDFIDRIRIDSSNVRKTKCFGKETSKKNSWEKLLDR